MKSNTKTPESLQQELKDIGRVIADIEITNKVGSFLKENNDTVLDMSSLNSIYNNVLQSHDCQ